MGRGPYPREKRPRGLRALIPDRIKRSLPTGLRRFLASLPNRIRYVGWRRHCPCCGFRARTFLPHGMPGSRPRPNARCPVCGSLERHRLMTIALERRVDTSPPCRVLHAAPEEAIRRQLTGRAGIDYTSVDLASPQAHVHADLAAGLPYRSSTFDLIICSHVLEHVVDDRAAMREIRRVLRDGGVAIIIVPVGDQASTYEDPEIVDPQDRLEHFGQMDHVRIYGRDLFARLEESGFEVELVDPTDVATPDEVERCRLRAGEKLLLCR